MTLLRSFGLLRLDRRPPECVLDINRVFSDEAGDLEVVVDQSFLGVLIVDRRCHSRTVLRLILGFEALSSVGLTFS